MYSRVYYSHIVVNLIQLYQIIEIIVYAGMLGIPSVIFKYLSTWQQEHSLHDIVVFDHLHNSICHPTFNGVCSNTSGIVIVIVR